MENQFVERLRKDIERTIRKCQVLGVDAFGFGQTVVRNFLTIQELEEYNWLQHFKTAETATEVEFTIRRTGTIIKTNPTRTTEGVKK